MNMGTADIHMGVWVFVVGYTSLLSDSVHSQLIKITVC